MDNSDASHDPPEPHQLILTKKIYQMFGESRFCDVKLIINDVSYPVNGLILASCGTGFSNILKNETKEIIVNYCGKINADTISSFFQLIHTGCLDIYSKDLEDVIEFALWVKADLALKFCFYHYAFSLTEDNAVIAYNLFHKYDCNDDILMTKSKTFIVDKFLKIVTKESFLKIDSNLLADILSSDDLHVKFEPQVFKAVMLWLNANTTDIKKRMCSLFLKVRFSYISLEFFIAEVMPELNSCDTCVGILRNVTYWHTNVKKRNSVSLPHLFGPPRRHTFNLMIVGGVNTDSNCICINDGCAEKNFKQYINLFHIIEHSISLVVYNELIIFENCTIFNKVWKVNLQNQVISYFDKAPILNFFDVVEISGNVYICGGIGLIGDYRRSVNKWNLMDKEWVCCSPMKFKRARFRAIVYEKKIYAFGGMSNDNCILDSAEIYYPETNEWKMLPPMLINIHSFSIAATKKYIYTIGGRNETGELSYVQRFNTEFRTWKMVASLPEKSSERCAVGLDGGIFYSGTTGFWRYFERKDMWDRTPITDYISSRARLFWIPTFHNDSI